MSDLISRQAAIDEIDEWIKAFRENGHKESAADACLIKDGVIQLPSAQPEIVRCGECVYRRRCMLQHFVESNAVDSTKIDWSEWYCADGVWDINVPRKSDERREKE